MAIRAAFLQDAKIVIIGAGAVGSVIAYRLAQAGAHVTVVERRFPGSGTTGNSFAWLNSFGKQPRDYHRLNVRSIAEHQDLARELNGEWVHCDGGLIWAHHGATDHAQGLRDTVRGLHQYGYRVEVLNPEQVMRELEPDLFIDPALVEEVYYAPAEGWVNGVGLCHGVLDAARRRYGATVINAEVVGFGGADGQIDSVTLATGEILPADAVINASGPDAARVAALAGIDLPVNRQPGLLVVTEPAPVNLKRVVHAPETFVHADGGWRLLLHRDDYDAQVESEIALPQDHEHGPNAIANASKIVPNLKGIKPEAIHMGIRAMPKDGHPIIGFDPAVSGIYHAVMHSGVTLSATVGNLVLDDLLGGDPAELAPYRPARFTDGSRLDRFATSE